MRGTERLSVSADKRSRVAAVRCGEYEEKQIQPAVERVFDLLGGIDRFVSPGETVLIKPNFIVPRPREAAAQTDPAVILAVARAVADCGGRVWVGDSPAWNRTIACIRVLGLEEPLKKLGAEIKPLNRPKRFDIAGSKVNISSVALSADKIINLPKLKAHQQLGATFAIKNMFGIVCGKQKAWWHFAKGKDKADFCRMLVEIYRLAAPVVNIIDGVVAMEGMGPINGRPRPLGFLIGGKDPLACEHVCSELVNFDPLDLPLLQAGIQMGLGAESLSQVEIVGDSYAEHVCQDFEFAKQTPLDFTLSRVCRSIAKQVVITLRSRVTKS